MATRKKSSAPAKKGAQAPAGRAAAAPSFKVDAANECVVADLSVAAEGLEPILGASYLLMDRAFALLEGDRAKKLRVTLRPKEPSKRGPAELKALGEAFVAELQTQKVRWAISKNNQPIREFIAEQAVLLANGQLPEPAPAAEAAPPAEELSQAQRQEIEKLIAEVEAEIKSLNDKKPAADPKNIAASWEEKQAAQPKAKGEVS